MRMEPGIFGRVKKFAQKVKVVYVATANKKGIPHLAASEGMTFVDQDRIFFRAWFCLRTVENLLENPRLSLGILDPKTQEGYQLLGEMERIEKGAILDGYAP
jgi:general stress protein 26